MRRRWTAWLWPVATFVAIGAFLVVTMVLRDGARTPSPGAPAAGPLNPAVHVNTRAWGAVAADSAGHAGERLVLWGQVTHIDPGGEASTLGANVDSARHTPQNGTVNYPTPVVLRGEPYLLRPLASGDIFTAEVTVDGTAPGGRLPLLTVTALRVTDRTVG